jgi:hypothetical protein
VRLPSIFKYLYDSGLATTRQKSKKDTDWCRRIC